MSQLPYYQGYPIVVAISCKQLNIQLANLAKSGQLPKTWKENAAKDHNWEIDAEFGDPYIDFPAKLDNAVRLNFPITRGTFTSYNTGGPDHSIESQSVDLAENVLGIITPIGTKHESFSDSTLSIKNIYLDLNSAQTKTIVRTKDDVETLVVDATKKASLAQRFQTEIREKTQGSLIFNSSITRDPSSNYVAGCLEPVSSDFSVFRVFDKSYPAFDPRRSERTTMNWLLSTKSAQPPSGDRQLLGRFDRTPLPDDEDGVTIVSFAALVECNILPIIVQSVNHIEIGPDSASVDNFASDNSPKFWMCNRFRPFQKIEIYPGSKPILFGDAIVDVLDLRGYYPHEGCIRADFLAVREFHKDTKLIFKLGSRSVKVTLEWSLFFTVSMQNGKIIMKIDDTKIVGHSKHSESGIDVLDSTSFFTNFIDRAKRSLKKFLNKYNSQMNDGIKLGIPDSISRIRILGDKQYDLHSARILNGNLVLGLSVR